MCRTRGSSSSQDSAGNGVDMICLYKSSPSHKVGCTFAPDRARSGDSARIVYLHPNGEAERCGLCLGDRVLSINSAPFGSSLAAASLLRDAVGDVWLCVQRSDLCAEPEPSSPVSAPSTWTRLLPPACGPLARRWASGMTPVRCEESMTML